MKLFSTCGQPEILHSDQGRNFESTVLAQTLNIQKSQTTAYHPQGDGMVERFHTSLLQLLQTYVEKQEDRERYLPLVTLHQNASTHFSPFMQMFGCTPSTSVFSPQTGFHIRHKLAELQDFVECAHHQKTDYDKCTAARQFAVGDLVWLSVPTAGKLDPQWGGGKWRIKAFKSAVTMEVTDGRQTRVVHVN